MEKKKLPIRVWLLLLGSVLCLIVGIVLYAQYSIEMLNIKSVVTEKLERSPNGVLYTYTNHSGKSESVGFEKFNLEDDDRFIYVISDIHSEQWVSVHKTFGKGLIIVGIILLIVFAVQFFKCIEGEEFISILKFPSIGFIIGCLICLLGNSMLGTSEAEVERSMNRGDGDPNLDGEMFLVIGIGIVCFSLYKASKAVSRYRLKKYNPEEYKRLVERERIQEQKNAEVRAREKARAEAMKPECPYCHSHNTSKITTSSKVAHTVVFGVFSMSRNSKQWHCNNCKSNF